MSTNSDKNKGEVSKSMHLSIHDNRKVNKQKIPHEVMYGALSVWLGEDDLTYFVNDLNYTELLRCTGAILYKGDVTLIRHL